VKQPDSAVEQDQPKHIAQGHRKDTADEHLPQVLRALRGFVDHDQCRGGGDHVDHADKRFLRDFADPPATRREQRGARRGEQ